MLCIFNVAAVQYADSSLLNKNKQFHEFNSIQFDSILSGLLLKPMSPIKTFARMWIWLFSTLMEIPQKYIILLKIEFSQRKFQLNADGQMIDQQ